MKPIIVTRVVVTLAAFTCLATQAEAASVGPSGYTNAFDAQPVAADWSTAYITGSTGTITNAAQLDTAVTNLAAGSIRTALILSTNNPPSVLNLAAWCTNGYVQTRPTAVGATVLMLTLLNGAGSNVTSIRIAYDYVQVGYAAEEVVGHRVYYSLTGSSRSWTIIPALCSAAPGRVSASVEVPWNAGSPLYLLWADENGSPYPDTGLQLDNFYVGLGAGTPDALSVTLTAPANGSSYLSGCGVVASVLVSGTPTNVTYYFNDVPSVTRTTPPFAPVTVSLAPGALGAFTVYATARDAAGAVARTATNTIVVSSNQPSLIAITNTFSGGVTGWVYRVGTCVTNQLTVSDPDSTVTNVDWYENGQLRARIPFNLANWNTILVNDALAGTTVLQAVAWDACGWRPPRPRWCSRSPIRPRRRASW